MLGQLLGGGPLVVIDPAFPNQLHTPPPCRPSPNPVRRHSPGWVGGQPATAARQASDRDQTVKFDVSSGTKIGNLKKSKPKTLRHDEQQH
jgi:hypothetical protein